jgi:hypothetical protein
MGWATEESRFDSGSGKILAHLYSVRHSGWPGCPPRASILQVTVALPPGMKQPDRKADHSPSPIVEVQGARSYASTHPAVLWP